MSKNIGRFLISLALCTVISTGSAWAQGRGHGRGNASNQVWSSAVNRDVWNNRDWRGDRDRWTFGNDQRPRGWDKGKKTGWGNCDVPPGQAKKMGCRSGLFGVYSRRDARRDRIDRRRDNIYRDRDRDRR